MADFALPLVLSSEDLYGQFSVRNAKFKYLPSRGVRLVPGYTLYSSYVVLFATMTPNILISSVKIIFRHKSWNTFTEVFHYFPTMRCIFDNSGFWAIFYYSSHDASSSDLVFSHTLWRHQSFRETIHPLYTLFLTYTPVLLLKQIAQNLNVWMFYLYVTLFLYWFFCAPAFRFHFRNLRFHTNRHGCYSKDDMRHSSCSLIAEFIWPVVLSSEHLYGQ